MVDISLIYVHLVSLIHPTRESQSLSDEAYAQIRSMIISCELRPGSVISESELMAALEMGRTPIREALRNLDRKSTRLNSSHVKRSRMPSSA